MAEFKVGQLVSFKEMPYTVAHVYNQIAVDDNVRPIEIILPKGALHRRLIHISPSCINEVSHLTDAEYEELLIMWKLSQ